MASRFSQPEGSMFEETTFVFKPGRNKLHSTKKLKYENETAVQPSGRIAPRTRDQTL